MEQKSISSQLPENNNSAGNSPRLKRALIWGGAAVLLSSWMFFLGILVGRGTAPVQFDTKSLQKELLALKRAAVEKTLRQYETDSKNADERKGVVFYDLLKRSGDGPDPQWSPRQQRPAPAPMEPSAISVPPALSVPSGSSEPPASSEPTEVLEASATQPGAGEPKPVTDTKDPNAPIPVKVVSEAFKKPATLRTNPPLKTVAMLKPTEVLKPAEVIKPIEVTKPTEVVKTPEKNMEAPSPSGSWTIQVAALKDTVEADRIVARLKQQGYPAFRLTGEIVGKGVWHRVRIGSYPGREEANVVVAKLNKEGLSPIAINTGGGKE